MFQTQLPNRLGKMLAPLRWHDYKKKYGKLDDFVASHPEVSYGCVETICLLVNYLFCNLIVAFFPSSYL